MASSGMAAWYGFTGEQQDSASGLTYLRARYYNPALGRFLTPDSLIPDMANGQALNAYAYVYNDPINLVDPSGNFPNIGDAVVSAALSAPKNWQPAINWLATGGLGVYASWMKLPDDCDCQTRSGDTTRMATGIRQKAAYPLANLALALYTQPAMRVATQVGQYSSAQAPPAFRQLTQGLGVQKLYQSYNNVDITNLRQIKFSSSKTLISPYSGKTSILLRMQDGRQVYLKNVTERLTEGIKGSVSSIVGSGLIDGLFQVFDDWITGQCLSLNQSFWRFLVALEFGLVGGLLGTAATILAVYLGATMLTAGLIGFGTSMIIGGLLKNLKYGYIEGVTFGARR